MPVPGQYNIRPGTALWRAVTKRPLAQHEAASTRVAGRFPLTPLAINSPRKVVNETWRLLHLAAKNRQCNTLLCRFVLAFRSVVSQVVH